MRLASIADAVAADWLADLVARSPYVGLSTADPFSVVDPLTVEVVGPAYGRIAVDWLTSGRLMRNADIMAFVGIPAGTTIAAITGWDAAFNGNISFSVAYGPSLWVAAGGLTLAAEEFYVGLGAAA